MKKMISLVIFLILPLHTVIANALPYYGLTLSIPVVADEPPHVTGFQLMLNYDPQRFQWRKFNVYFDGGYTLYRDTEAKYHRTINIYSIAPVIRYTFRSCGPVFPYIEMSIGAAWLSHTRFEKRKLGIHYSFQDRMGFGVYVGQCRQFSLGFHAIHYSNAHLARHNSGITIPLEVDVGYRFQ